MNNAIALLGSTGSVGQQTLAVARELGLCVAALAARSSVKEMERQCRAFRPRLAALADAAAAQDLAVRLKDTPVKVIGGAGAAEEAAAVPEAETVVSAVVGLSGLGPTLSAVRAGKRIALANKETLVCAGELVMAEAQRWGAEILPVDSEHSAIFQCLQGCRDIRAVRRVILTCSGGPFLGRRRETLRSVTPAEALRHPNWAMGPKISVDSATLMNKGLEVIEAMRLYRLPLERVQVTVHPQSIVHSLVEFRDGAMLAQLGTADMRLPIRYALTYPRREESAAPALDLFSLPPLTFAPPDRETFPCLALAERAAAEGGTACAVLNGANEAAVDLFLAGRIGFYDIPRLIEAARQAVPTVQDPGLDAISEADRAARRAAAQAAGKEQC